MRHFFYFSAFFLFGLSSFCADIIPKEEQGDTTFPRRVADQFFSLIVDQLESNVRGVNETVIGLGRSMTAQEFDDQVFYFTTHSNFESLGTVEAVRLYQFLKKNGFLRRVGKINAQRVVNNPVPKVLIPFQKQLKKLVSQGTQINSETMAVYLVTNEKISSTVFDVCYHAAIFPKAARSLNTIDSPMRWLFTPNKDVEKAFADLNDIDQKIQTDLKKLQIAWSIAEIDWDRGIRGIREGNYGPTLFRSFLSRKKVMKEQKRKEIAKEIACALSVHKEQITSRPKIEPTPINLMLLYSFYLNERELHRVLAKSNTEFLWYQSLMMLYEVENNAPHISLLAPMAKIVLDSLGFEAQSSGSKGALKTSRIQSSIRAQSKSTAKKQLKKQKPKKEIQLEAKDSLELSDKENVFTNSSTQEAPNENTIRLIAEETVKSSDVTLYEAPEPKKAIKRRSDKPSILYAEHNAPRFSLTRTRGHRALDMLAFLLRRQVYSETNGGAGTIALALAKDHQGNDQFVIATKYDLPPDLMQKIFKDIIKHRLTRSKNTIDFATEKALLLNAKNALRELNNLQASEPLLWQANKNYLHHKSDLYAIRLQKIIEHPRDSIENRIAILLAKNLVPAVVPNPLFMHPELKLASYLLEYNLPLGQLPHDQFKLPYQYIGCSMLNCAMCDSLLRGRDNIRGLNYRAQENNLVFFSKGSYEVCYPGFEMPDWSMRINQMSASNLRALLHETGETINKVDNFRVMSLQSGEVTDSDDDSSIEENF